MTDTIDSGLLTRQEEIRTKIRARMPDVIADLRAKAGEHGERPRREAGYTIHNAAGEEAVVRIYDEIWWLGVNALDLVADLDAITAPKIRVEINSPGGDVFDGIAIYNALRLHPADITTRVDGIAASIASVIAQAGDHRVMVASSQMMIHNAWGMTIGDQSDHQEMVALLEMQDGIIADIYATKADKDIDHFRTLMNAETWMTAEQAVSEGLADEVLEPADTKPKDTLQSKIAAAVSAADVAVSSAVSVSAVRAEAGKPLSTVNLEGLSGLRDSLGQLEGLLTPQQEHPEHPDITAARHEAARHDTEFRAAIPPRFL